MRKIAALVLILSALFLSAASFVISSAPSAPPVTVPYVDIKKYLGLWYEQAVIPFFWERNCIKSTAGYSLYNNGSIRVEYFVVYSATNAREMERLPKMWDWPFLKTRPMPSLRLSLFKPWILEVNTGSCG